MIAVIQGGHESEAEISRMTSKSFQKALEGLKKEHVVIEYNKDLVEQLKKLNPSCVLIAMHGKYGEDGTLQALLEHLEIPYTGSGVFASSLSFDKIRSSRWAQQNGVRTLPHFVLSSSKKNLGEKEREELASWSSGYVVKPAQSGSSRGVYLCESLEELPAAVEGALKWSDQILVEKRVRGSELTVSLLNGVALEPIEIRPKKGFYDMENKYTAGATDYLIPAPISNRLKIEIQRASEEVYKSFNLDTYARVDFLVEPKEVPAPGEVLDGTPYFMEVNTLPGCTENSLLPKALAYKGVPFTQLVENLIQKASLKS